MSKSPRGSHRPQSPQAPAQTAPTTPGWLAARFWNLAQAGTVVVALCTLTVFVGKGWWFLDLYSHFCVQYLACLVLAAAVFAMGRKWRWTAAAGVFAAVNLALVAPFYLGHSADPGATPGIRVLSLNVRGSNRETERVLRLVEREKPDVLVLMEVTHRWARELEPLRAEYPHGPLSPLEGNFGLAVLSRQEFLACRPVRLGRAELPSVLCRLPVGDQVVTLIATHPLPPVTGRYARLRNQQLLDAAALAAAQLGPVAVVGDLNITPWSPWFRALLREGGLSNARRGHGLRPTWPAGRLPLRIPIDHCLVSEGLIPGDLRTGPPVGSDHLPLIVDLALR